MAKSEWHLGIDLGGTKILAGVFGSRQGIVGRAKRKTRGGAGDADSVLERIVRTALEAVAEAKLTMEDIRAIGISVPGPIDPDAGMVIEAPNLGWRNVNVVQYMVDALGRPTFLSNDVSAGTWGEFCLGAGRGARNLVGVFVGTGIGGGIIINERLYLGSSKEAGEIGHICLNPHGPICGCGRNGCLEAFASRTAITRDIWAAVDRGQPSSIVAQLKDRNEQMRSRMLRQAFEEGDEVVREAMVRSAHFLGIGLGSIVNILNPDRIVLGGGVVEAFGKDYIRLVVETYERMAFASAAKTARVVEAELGDDAGIIGSALLADEKFKALQPNEK